MDTLRACITNEVQKLFLMKKNFVFMIILVLISALSALLLSTIQSRLMFISLTSISFPLLMLSIVTNVFLPLFIFMAAAELFSGEIADRTLKLTLTMPISRLKIYISKLTAIIFYTILNLLVVLLVSTLAAVGSNMGIDSILQVFLSYLVDIVPLSILAIFAAFIVQFFRSISTALISSILAFIGLRVLGLVVPGLNHNLFTTYLNWSSSWFSSGISFLQNINLLILLIAYGIIFFTLGYYLFDKREV